MVYRSSFSQHNRASHHLRWWYYEKVLKIPYSSDMCYANAGTSVHNTMQAYYDGDAKSMEEAKEVFFNNWNKYKLEDTKLKLQKDTYWLMCVNGIDLNKTLTSTEMKIFFPDCVCYIDGVDANNHEIIDWKSSNRSVENEEEYQVQLKLYCWMYYRKFNVLLNKATVHYLRYNGTRGELSFEPTMDDIKEIETWYNEVLAKMEKTIEAKQLPPVCDECSPWCPYQELCGKDSTGGMDYKLYITGNYVKVEGPITELIDKVLNKKFSYELKNAFFMKKANPHINTTVQFWNLKRRIIPLGMMTAFIKTLKDYGKFKKVDINIDVIDKRTFNDSKVDMPDKFLNGIILRDYQKEAANEFVKNKIGILELGTGAGKCFAKNTKILMYDLSIKNVQDIKVGELIMGDDGTSRKVLSLANGYEQMYKVKQSRANDYIVNESHILSLRKTNKKYEKMPDKIDVPITEYINFNINKKRCFKGYKVDIELTEQIVDIEPYWLGLWLGDGGHKSVGICNMDKEVINYLNEYANRLGMKCVVYEENRGPVNTYAITNGRIGDKQNKLLNALRKYNLIGNKHIPSEYIKNSKKIRLELLAGLIDSDGYVGISKGKGRSIDITQKRENLINEIYMLGNSLGFYCTKGIKIMKSGDYIGNKYYWVSIRGNLGNIPTKIPRKKLYDAYYSNRYKGTSINIEKLNKDKYYGFEIDGNKRFLLDDFTVVHNTEICIEIVRQLGMKTLFVVDKVELLRQTKKRMEAALGIEIGQLGSGEKDIKDVTVATIQTLMKDPKQFKDYLGSVRLCIFDEAHKAAAKSYAKLARYVVNTEYRLGVSGTAFRDDGNDMMINAVTGYKVFDLSSKVLIEKGWLIKPNIIFVKEFMDEGQAKDLEQQAKTGLINETPEYSNYYKTMISENPLRNDAIRKIVKDNVGKKILLLTKLVDHGKHLEDTIPNSKHLYGETNKKAREEIFNDFVDGKIDVLISTISIFAEGIDIPTLDVVINTSANKGDVKTIQVLGRVLRKIHGKKNAQYIDFMDKGTFFYQASMARFHALMNEGHDIEFKVNDA